MDDKYTNAQLRDLMVTTERSLRADFAAKHKENSILIKSHGERLTVIETGMTKNNEETTATGINVRKLREEFTIQSAKVQPAIDAVETMQSGVRFLGKIGNGVTWIAERATTIGRWLLGFIALGIFGKVLWQTGSISKAIEEFVKWFK